MISPDDTLILRHQHQIRFQHMFDRESNRLVGTIATRSLADGTVDVAATIAHPNQGIVKNNPGLSGFPRIAGRAKETQSERRARKAMVAEVEPPPSRRLGRKYSLSRLLNGNKNNERFTPAEAIYILESGPHCLLRGAHRSAADVLVVNFSKEELKEAIRNRTILRFFQGARWVPALRPSRNFDSTRLRKVKEPEQPKAEGLFLRASRWLGFDK